MRKITALLLVIMMLAGVFCMFIKAEETELDYGEKGNTDCTCGGSYGNWIYPGTGSCVGERYYRECDGCDNVQTAKDIVPKTVSFTVPAIGANAGDLIMLSLYDVYFDADTVVPASEITWSSDDIEIVSNQICPTEAGTYKLIATAGTQTKAVYAVIKNPTDTEYVLFFDGFERDASSQDENGRAELADSGYNIVQKPSGTDAYIQNGKLVLDAKGSDTTQMRVILPEWIGDFGDYKIDTVFTIDSTVSNDNSRWFATMARVKNDSDYFPLWQAAVRKGAKSHSSGVEISYTTNGTKWEVPCKNKYTEDISSESYYTQTFEIVGTEAYHSINGTPIQNTVGKSKEPSVGVGLVGFHLRAALVYVDSVKIVVPIDDSIHIFSEWETVTKETCTTNGLEKRTCNVCNATEERVIEGGHKLVSHAMVVPTCTTSGWSAYDECSVCDYTTFMGTVPALGHYFDREVRFVAHRGYSSVAPENTLAAYRLAKHMGYTYAECDVSITKDGVAVLLHDSSIDRTSNGSGNISELNYDDIKNLDFGSWKSAEYAGEKIPTFEEFIALCAELGIHPYIELKKGGGYSQEKVNELVAIVEKYGMEDNCSWISFESSYLKYVKNADATARLGYVSSSTITQSLINTAKSLLNGSNEVFLDMSYGQINDTTALLVASNGIELEAWTADTTAKVKNLPKYVSGITFEKISPETVLLNAAVTEPTCDEQGYTTYTCICGETAVRDYVPAHSEETVSISYPNGFDKVGIKVVRCLGCDAGETELEAPALFTCLGYSVPKNGRSGVSVGFEVNGVALKEYEDVMGKSLRYGAFAVSEGKIEGNEIFDEYGNVFDGAICAEVTEYGFSIFHIEIVGFADSQKDLKFAMGAYIAEADGTVTEYSYIQREMPSGGDLYHFTSYNAVINSKNDEEEVE